MGTQNNLQLAQYKKNDEFYTTLDSIEHLFENIWYYLKGKSVICNCNDAESNFYVYFHRNFSKIGLKRLICINYNHSGNKLFVKNGSYYKEYLGGDDDDLDDCIVVNINGTGSYDSNICLNLLRECDICITNPPFHSIKDYYDVVKNSGKDFIFFNTLNLITYEKMLNDCIDKKLFPYTLYDNKYTLNHIKFVCKNSDLVDLGNICLWTNVEEFHKPFYKHLNKTLNDIDYRKYDGTEIIVVNSINDIPIDYYGVLGVPINFIMYLNFDEFKLLGSCKYNNLYKHKLLVDGKEIYRRLLIQRI